MARLVGVDEGYIVKMVAGKKVRKVIFVAFYLSVPWFACTWLVWFTRDY